MNYKSKSSLVLGKDKLNKALLVNLIVLFILSNCFFVWGQGFHAAYSCVIGGLVYLICQYFFALFFFAKGGASQATQIVKRMFWGECFKLLFTFAALACIFYYNLAQPLPLLLGFIFMVMGGWILPWILKD